MAHSKVLGVQRRCGPLMRTPAQTLQIEAFERTCTATVQSQCLLAGYMSVLVQHKRGSFAGIGCALLCAVVQYATAVP
jgi:hypothetical protein